MKSSNTDIKQGLGRMFREGRSTIEQQVANRVAAKLLITDETILLKNGQIIMLGRSEGVGHSLHLDKKKKAGKMVSR